MSFQGHSEETVRLLPTSVEALINRWLWRTVGFVIVAVAIALWLSLVTWSKTDPSLTHATSGDTRNLLGPIGAVLSDLMLQMFGMAAVLWLLGPIIWGVQLAASDRLPSLRWKILLFCAAVLLVGGGLSSLPTASTWPLEHGYGGFVGDLVFSLVSGVAGFINEGVATFIGGLVCIGAGCWLLMEGLGLNGRDLRLAWTVETPRSLADLPRPPPLSKAHQTPQSQDKPQGLDRTAGLAGGFTQGLATAGSGSGVGADAKRWIGGLARDAKARWNSGGSLYNSPSSGSSDLQADSSHAMPSTSPRATTQGHAPAQYDHDVDEPAYRSANVTQDPRFDPDYGADRGSYEPAVATDNREFTARTMDRAHSIDMRDPAVPSAGPIPAFYDPTEHDPAAAVDPFDALTDASSRGIAARFAHRPQAQDTAQTRGPQPKPKASFLKPQPKPKPKHSPYRAPSLNLLQRGNDAKPGLELTQTVLRGNARLLEDVLADFGIKGQIREVMPGPVITLYELEIARGIKASRVIGLADDIARSMSAQSARISVIPGRNTLGIELPNLNRSMVRFRNILESDAYKSANNLLPLALGKSIDGTPVATDLARMPHLLVAGTTGSGKSVGVNAMILSLLYRYGPDQLRMLMVDPKMLELSVYNGIPHLLTPVVTDPQKAIVALNWAIQEMEERYKRMAELGVRNISAFNTRLHNAMKRGETLNERVQTGFDPDTGEAVYELREIDPTPLPHIVIIVDEFADLMIVAGKEIEAAIQRLAQMARAAGIHIIMATQRPSVDIVTGTIKANFPSRIGFKVASKVDSRTIINEQGAEQLLGEGDMLMTDGSGQLTRVHGAFISDEEVEAVAAYLRTQPGPGYVDDVTESKEPQPAAEESGTGAGRTSEDLYDKAVAIVVRDRKASTSYIQRRLQIGYNRAADLIERMEQNGIVGPANHAGKREIFAAGE